MNHVRNFVCFYVPQKTQNPYISAMFRIDGLGSYVYNEVLLIQTGVSGSVFGYDIGA